jgi:hypothetical protein
VHASMQFEINLHRGSLYYKLQPMDPAIDLRPPFQAAVVTDEVVHLTTSFCNVEYFPAVHKYYLSIRGGSECAYYSIRPRLVTGERLCEDERFVGVGVGWRWVGNVSDFYKTPSEPYTTGECDHEFDHDSALDSLDSIPRLQLGKHTSGTCQANSYLDYAFEISEEEAKNNLLFQVEDLSVNDNPNALRVQLVRKPFLPSFASPLHTNSPRLSHLSWTRAGIWNARVETAVASGRCRPIA